MDWLYTSPKMKKTRTVPFSRKVMGTVFWDAEGCILIDFLLKGRTISVAHYIQTLRKQ
jgi:hypothetical protein